MNTDIAREAIEELQEVRKEIEQLRARAQKVRVVFDGPPSHESGRFIEVENADGESISFGEWKEADTYWYLEFDALLTEQESE